KSEPNPRVKLAIALPLKGASDVEDCSTLAGLSVSWPGMDSVSPQIGQRASRPAFSSPVWNAPPHRQETMIAMGHDPPEFAGFTDTCSGADVIVGSRSGSGSTHLRRSTWP